LEKPGTVSGLIGSDRVVKMEQATLQSFAVSATARGGAAAAVAFAMVGGQKTRRVLTQSRTATVVAPKAFRQPQVDVVGGSLKELDATVHRKTARSSRVALLGAVEAVPPPPPPFSPAEQLGVTQPLGYFDPLGFCKVGDEVGFHKLRCAEIKHGRVAMLAAVGTVFQHFVKLPGFEKTPAGLAALGDAACIGALVGLIPVVFFLEMFYWKDDLSKEPGNFGDPADWAGTGLGGAGSYSDDMRNKELNNGRMAMFSILGIMIAELATGKDGVQQLGF